MDLRHLRYFVAVAEEGHVTRAALRLGMQQPPLSQQLRVLERELGTPLFHRLPRGMALTAAGAMFLVEARALLERSERCFARARLAAAGQVGEAVVGVTTSALLHPLVPRALGRFHLAHPTVSLDLREANAAELTERLARGEIDLALVRAPVARPFGLAFEELASEHLVVVLPRHHALGGRRVGLGRLRDERFILVRRPGAPGLYAQLLESCRAIGFEPTVAAEVGRMFTAISLVAAGVGVTLVPAAMSALRPSGVGYATLTGAGAPRAPLTVAFHKEELRPVVIQLLQTLRAAAAPHYAAPATPHHAAAPS